MGSNIGTILSMVFVALFFVLGVDIMSIQFAYTRLDQVATTFSYVIAKEGGVKQSTIDSYCEKYDVVFTCKSNCTPKKGDIVDYQLSCDYSPLIIAKQDMLLTIERSTVIGFYN